MVSHSKIVALSKQLEVLKHTKTFVEGENVVKMIAGFFWDGQLTVKPFRSTKMGERTKNRFHNLPWHGSDLPCTLEVSWLNIPIDFRFFWLKKASKQIIAWVSNFTHNYEDSPVFADENVGIDIILPDSTDKVILVLTNKYVLRTLELYGSLSATQEEILHQWVQDFGGNKKLIHETLWQSFNIKPLNIKFYQAIARAFTELVQHLERDGIDSHEAKLFTNRLIWRIVFCWFLKKKNIIAEQYNYFELSDQDDSTSYYHSILSTLFFATLNLPVAERTKKVRELGVDIQTPYLNGWLFEKKAYDTDTKVTFPVKFFHTFFEFLNGYNFTTDESTSSYQQVAVDPEMLGRIFENLLAEQNTETGEQARKAKGAFYTPREIVDFMCKESLKTHISQKLLAVDVVESEREIILEQLFAKSDSEYALYSKNAAYDAIQVKHRWKIIDILDNMTVIDPACGSGAFPMGMMQIILQCYERILPETKFDPVETKKKIIENTLFGVDIEPMAIEISRLRAWLAIIVDEIDANKVEPLPNLDFKFICANSLIKLHHNEWWLWDKPDLKETLAELRHKYYRSRTTKSKTDIKDKYLSLINDWNLFESKYSDALKSFNAFDASKPAKFFDPEYMFWESWFDIVIGNPPWDKVKAQDPKFFSLIDNSYRSLSKEEQKLLKNRLLENTLISKKYHAYVKECNDFGEYINHNYVLQWSSDHNLFKVFTELAINLSKTTVSFLIPWSITIDQWSEKMRKYILDNRFLKKMVWYTNKKSLFDGIDNNQKFITLILQKKPSDIINILWWIDDVNQLREEYIVLSPTFYQNFDSNYTFYIDNDRAKYAIYSKILDNVFVKALKDIDFHYWWEYHATNDAHYFNDKEWKYKIFSGKCINIYDAMQKSWLEKHWRSSLFEVIWYPKPTSYRTEYFVSDIPDRILSHHKADDSRYRIVIQNVTGTVNNLRTVYSSLLHRKHLTNNSLHNLFLWKNDKENIFYLSFISSFVLDWQARLKTATNLNKFILETFLVPLYETVDKSVRDKIIENTLRLISVCDDYDELVQAILWVQNYKDVLVINEIQRQEVKNTNDALMAKVYDLTYDEFHLILSTFPLIDQKIKDDVLEKFKTLW